MCFEFQNEFDGIKAKFESPVQFTHAVDIALAKNTPIKSILSGRVIFADWTPNTGNVVIIRHNNGFISVYKHAASVTVSQGDKVRTGEVIALAGSTGQESTGVHLHFELWKGKTLLNPSSWIIIKK